MLEDELQAQIEAEKQQILEEEAQPVEEPVEEEPVTIIESESGSRYRRFTEVVSTGINYVLYAFYAITLGLILNLFTFITKGIVDMISRVADKIYEENDKYAQGQEFNYKKFLSIAFAIFMFVIIAIVVAIYLFCRL